MELTSLLKLDRDINADIENEIEFQREKLADLSDYLASYAGEIQAAEEVIRKASEGAEKAQMERRSVLRQIEVLKTKLQ